MAVICKKCGRGHPTWDCSATAAQIAAYSSLHRKVGEAKVIRSSRTGTDEPAPRLKSPRPVKQMDSGRGSDQKQRPKPAAKAGAGSGPRSAPAATISSAAVRKVIRGLKDALAHAKGDATKAVEHKRGRGRPKTIVNMRAYKAQKERERRARLKQEKSK